MIDLSPIRAAAVAAATLLLVACGDDGATAPPDTSELSRAHRSPLADTVRRLTDGRGITALERPAPVRQGLVRLGRALAFDKILSGNRDIACMTCHLPPFATGDARSLAIGQGATGLGPSRVHPDGVFIPRNAPSLFTCSLSNPSSWTVEYFKMTPVSITLRRATG
jgi:cytochrome c peroxidase